MIFPKEKVRRTSPPWAVSCDSQVVFTDADVLLLLQPQSVNAPVSVNVMADPPLASLSLTHVHYDPADPLSHLSAYLALVPQALVITYAALTWSTREIEILLMFAGQMGCEALNWGLKRYIKEERPTRTFASTLHDTDDRGKDRANKHDTKKC